VHIIGEIKLGLGFGDGVSCKWKIDKGKHWGVLDGLTDGHTQTAYGPEGVLAVWNHPVDIHYQTTSMQGWPKLIVQIQHLDEYGRVQIIAHGFAHIPCTPGSHEITVSCWRATGTQREELRAFFLNEYPVLLDEDLVYHKATSYRHRLVTVPSGKVTAEFNIITRFFAENSVDS
jgi:B9 domain-containing protein 2